MTRGIIVNNNALENSLLISVLLYRSAYKDSKISNFKAMSILGVIASSKGCTSSQISEMLNSRFENSLTVNDIKTLADSLCKKGIVRLDGDRYIAQESQTEAMVNQLRERISGLISGVTERVLRHSGLTVDYAVRNTLARNAEKALSTYFHHFGYAFVGLQSSSNELVTDAVKIARQNLPNRIADALVVALSDLLQKPSDNERIALETLARAFVTLELMNLDPLLRNFRYTKLRNKCFVVDTDVALHSLASCAKFSESYKMMISRLRDDAGCRFIIPEKVITEIHNHHRMAKGQYRKYETNVDELTDELLENNNVFLEDYVKLRRENPDKKDMTFDTYLRNFFDSHNPQLLRNKLLGIFGNKTEFWSDDKLAELDTDEKRDFASMIKAMTEKQDKGERRLDEHNEQIADVDAILYLTIKSVNDKEKTSDKALSHKMYLLTQSRKIKYAAEQKIGGKGASSCICNPAAIISVLNELGRTGGQEISYINLFDNPFLSFTAEKVWTQIKPVIDNNIQLKYADLERLRIDVDTSFDRLLTSKCPTEIAQECKLIGDKGYTFSEALAKVSSEILDRDKIIEMQQNEIAKLQKENEALKGKKSSDYYQNLIARKKPLSHRKKRR